MHDEADFLRKLLDNPADDTTRLVYADWLDERDDPASRDKAQFLRLTARLNDPKRPKGDDRRLQQLAAKLDTDWLAVVSRLKIEICAGKRNEAQSGSSQFTTIEVAGRMFEFVCEKKWDEMTPTGDDAVRHCEKCQEQVHYCDTLKTARKHAEKGHCIAVDLGVIRRPDDLSPRRSWLGRPSAAMLRQEEERCKLDAVSEERERRKSEAAG